MNSIAAAQIRFLHELLPWPAEEEGCSIEFNQRKDEEAFCFVWNHGKGQKAGDHVM